MMFRLLVLGYVVGFNFVAVANGQQPPTPSEEHQVLMRDVGEWTIQGKVMLPDGFQEFKGEEKVVAIGGFWTVSQYSSDALGGLKGSATMGYDPKAKKYIGTWVDSFQPSATQMKGTYDKESKTMTYMTTGIGMDGKPMPGKIVVKYKNKNSHVFTMMNQDPTGQTKNMVKTMEMTYTRKNPEKGDE